MLTRSCTIASKNKQTFISFHNIVLHNLVSKPSFHFTRSYILVNLQKLKQNTLFLLFHFFCIIMLRNYMIIDAKTKYFSILGQKFQFRVESCLPFCINCISLASLSPIKHPFIYRLSLLEQNVFNNEP
jgi:hypothetical protein